MEALEGEAAEAGAEEVSDEEKEKKGSGEERACTGRTALKTLEDFFFLARAVCVVSHCVFAPVRYRN